jgi:hypothetical protein
MEDCWNPAEAASSSGLRNDHCTELEHAENIVASEQAQSRGTSAFHVRNVGLAIIAVLSDRMRGLRREVELNRRGPPRAEWDAWGQEVVAAFAIGAAPPRSQKDDGDE